MHAVSHTPLYILFSLRSSYNVVLRTQYFRTRTQMVNAEVSTVLLVPAGRAASAAAAAVAASAVSKAGAPAAALAATSLSTLYYFIYIWRYRCRLSMCVGTSSCKKEAAESGRRRVRRGGG